MAWAEADLVVADEFREGNMPARQSPLPCVRAGFAALPAVAEAQWQTFGTEADGTLRQWAEVDFVPGLPTQATYSG